MVGFRCVAIPYAGVEHEQFVPARERRASGPVRLLFVGRLVPYKGLELLLRAVAVAVRQCRVCLTILGSGDALYQRFLQNLAGELGIAQAVCFEAPIARVQLSVRYQHADVFCFPTLCDTYGIALLEAMSCGCAVLVSDVAGAGEIVDGANGLKVRPRNPEQFIEQMAEALMMLARDAGLRSRLGAAARRYVLREHDWSRIGERILEIYEELDRG